MNKKQLQDTLDFYYNDPNRMFGGRFKYCGLTKHQKDLIKFVNGLPEGELSAENSAQLKAIMHTFKVRWNTPAKYVGDVFLPLLLDKPRNFAVRRP